MPAGDGAEAATAAAADRLPASGVEPLRTEQEVAERLRKSLSWLQHMRQTGGGPPYLKIGHAVRYRDEDVDAWLEQQLRQKVWQFDNKDAFEPVGDAADRVVDKFPRGRKTKTTEARGAANVAAACK